MCGVFATQGFEWLEECGRYRQLDLLHHRGPDGVRSFARGQFSIGHTRLKIIDQTERSAQTLVSESGLILAINCEIVNYKELLDRFQLKLPQHASDSVVALHIIDLVGIENALPLFEGMFAGVLYDNKTNTVHAFRDRFGVKPLYIYNANSNFIISSEIPPILSIIKNARANLSAVRDFLIDGLIDHSRDTFFEDIKTIDQGSLWSKNLNTSSPPVVKQWFILDKPTASINDYSTTQEQLEHLLSKLLTEYSISDFQVAVNLSDGIDSTLMAHLLKDNNNIMMHTIDFGLGSHAEDAYRMQNLRNNRVYHPFNVECLLEHLKEVVIHQAQPFTGIFLAGYSAMYSKARSSGSIVYLDANGLDEFFHGYSKYINKTSIPTYGADLGGMTYEQPFLYSEELHKIAPLQHRDLSEFCSFNSQQWKNPLQDLYLYKVPRCLRFNDHVSMQHSCELRVPWLDHRLLNFALTLDSSTFVDAERGIGKMVIRDLVAKHIGSKFAYSQKRIVHTLQSSYLTSDLYGFMHDLLLSDSFLSKGLVDIKSFRQYIHSIRDARLSNSYHLWRLISLELWWKQYIGV